MRLRLRRRAVVVTALWAIAPGFVRTALGTENEVPDLRSAFRPGPRPAFGPGLASPLPDGLRLQWNGGPSGPAAPLDEDCGLVQDYELLGLFGRNLLETEAGVPTPGAHLATSGSSVLWTETGTDPLWKADFDARTAEPLADRVGDHTDALVRRGDSVFWVDVGEADFPGCGSGVTRRLKRTLADGSGTTTLATLTSSGSVPFGLAVDEEAAYLVLKSTDRFNLCANTYSIVRYADHGSGAGETVVTGGADLIRGLAVDETNVYWTEQGGPSARIKRAPKLGEGPPTVLAEGSFFMGEGLTLDGGELFFADQTQQRILKLPVTGGAPTEVVTAGWWIDALAVDATSVYWIASNRLYRAPRSGGVREELTYVGGARSLFATGNEVYWIQPSANLPPEPSTLRKMPAAGGAITILHDQVDTYLSAGLSAGVLAADAERIYLGEAGRVTAVPQSGGDAVTLAGGISLPRASIATDGVFVYVADGARIKRVPLAGGTTETLQKAVATYIATDGSFLYWSNNLNIQRMPVAGGPPETVASIGGPTPLKLQGDEVFWLSSGSLWKAPKSGGAATHLFYSSYGISFDVDETGLYVSRPVAPSFEGQVLKLTLSGTNPRVLITGFPSAPLLALGRDDLYMLFGGAVGKAPKNGGFFTYLTYGLPTGYGSDAMLPVDGDLYFSNLKLGAIVRARPANALEFTVSPLSLSESAGKARVTVTRSGEIREASFVDYDTSDGDALGGSDYVPASGRLALGPKVRTRTFDIPLVADVRAQGHRSLLLRLSEPRCGRLGARSTAVLTITDDDKGGRVALGAPAYAVNEPGPFVTVKIQRLDGLAGEVSVDYATVDGSAVVNTHYSGIAGTLPFGPGVKSQTLVIPILDDGAVDGNKTFSLVLSDPQGGASLASPSAAAITIQEDNPVFQFAAPTFTAGEQAGRALVAVKRSGPSTATASVSYSTSDGTAKAGERYQAVSGTLDFGPGVSQRTFFVPLVNDTLFQGAQTVLLSLQGPSAGAALGQQDTAVLSLGDNDTAGTLSFAATTFRAARSAGTATVTVTRAGGTAGGVEVHYATADGSAQQGVHYTETSGTLAFGPGVTSRTFTVPLLEPGSPTRDVSVGLSLSAASGGAVLVAPAAAFLVIETSEAELAFSALSYTVNEAGPVARVTVKRSGPKTGTVSVDYATADDTATAGIDYTPASGELSFGPNVSVKTFDVPVSPSAELEGDQRVRLHLSDPDGGAVLGEPKDATLTIKTDEPELQLSSTAVTATEASGKALVRVRRGPPLTRSVSVDYATADLTAVEGPDYEGAVGTLTFPPGSAMKSFTVPLVNDSLDEPVESIEVALSTPTDAILGTASTGVVNISDNDVAGQMRFEALHFSARAASGVAVVTVVRSGGQASGARVDYATADGTATAGSHYEATTGTLVFDEGETRRAFTIPLLDDGAPGPNRTVILTLTGAAAGATLGAPAQATLWIVDGGG